MVTKRGGEPQLSRGELVSIGTDFDLGAFSSTWMASRYCVYNADDPTRRDWRAAEIAGIEGPNQQGDHRVDIRMLVQLAHCAGFLKRLRRIERLTRRDQQALLRTIDAFLGNAELKKSA